MLEITATTCLKFRSLPRLVTTEAGAATAFQQVFHLYFSFCLFCCCRRHFEPSIALKILIIKINRISIYQHVNKKLREQPCGCYAFFSKRIFWAV